MLPTPEAPKFHIDDHFKIEIIFQFKCLGLVRPPVSIITQYSDSVMKIRNNFVRGGGVDIQHRSL